MKLSCVDPKRWLFRCYFIRSWVDHNVVSDRWFVIMHGSWYQLVPSYVVQMRLWYFDSAFVSQIWPFNFFFFFSFSVIFLLEGKKILICRWKISKSIYRIENARISYVTSLVLLKDYTTHISHKNLFEKTLGFSHRKNKIKRNDHFKHISFLGFVKRSNNILLIGKKK